ncbi:hypothetical protein L6Q79_06230 [bacterium]|nr:hypothetical protein [bacterium]NUN44372.1 hypothetical protein [bacterium]
MQRIFGFLIFSFLMAGCGNTSRLIVYTDANYAMVEKGKNIRVKHVDGKFVQFYKMVIDKTDDEYIYARCWKTKKSTPEDLRFKKSEVILESTEFSVSRTTEYVMLIGVTILLIFLSDRILRG